MNDREYWENYYESHMDHGKPSSFANFVIETFQPTGSLIELGCGNGRDSIFFAMENLQVIGVDQCENVVQRLNFLNLPKAEFIKADFTKLTNHTRYDNIYSRFTLHSVNKADASRALNWAFSSLENNGYLFIEVRSIKDDLYGQGKQVAEDAWQTDHYRRFVKNEEFKAELEEIGFQIVYHKESRGLAPYKDEDPIAIRSVCKKVIK